MGRPRLFVGIAAGNLDSMLNKLTAQKKVRSEDQYSPGGQTGSRPNRATIVYSNLVRQAMPGVPVVLGGIEASLRRIAHYDYWSDSVRRSILLDAKADLLIFGMGERPVWEVAERLRARARPSRRSVTCAAPSFVMQKGTWEDCSKSKPRCATARRLWLPSYEEVSTDLHAFSEMSGALPARDQPGQRARPHPAARRPGALLQPARGAARHGADGRALRPAVRAQPHFGYTSASPPSRR